MLDEISVPVASRPSGPNPKGAAARSAERRLASISPFNTLAATHIVARDFRR